MDECPLLPVADGVDSARWMRRFGDDRGGDFYLGALRCAQGLWISGKPAQAILQLNRAFSADLAGDDPVLERWQAPYRALVWMLRRPQADAYTGNPVRHFQHLASRMSGPRAEVRTWRAWACFHLSERVLAGSGGYPRDEEQLVREGLVIPDWACVLERIAAIGWVGEPAVLQDAALGAHE
ncbi:MAG: hypothetical protein ACQCXQ_02690 [Verrucomicrobiales bacterium]|nr:hypothetical protein [Verrucomicrobiota bacterium JB025]